MLKRYIGEYSPVNVRLAGQDFGMLENGDSLVVPDELAEILDWPEANWDDGPAKKGKKTTTNNDNDEGDK